MNHHPQTINAERWDFMMRSLDHSSAEGKVFQAVVEEDSALRTKTDAQVSQQDMERTIDRAIYRFKKLYSKSI